MDTIISTYPRPRDGDLVMLVALCAHAGTEGESKRKVSYLF
jgi:hypothetical protein